MATIYSPLGEITGSVGNLTFSKRNGRNQLGQKISSNTSNTPAQQEVRAKFSLLASLYKGMSLAVQLGTKASGGQSSYNQFMANNYGYLTVDAEMNASADFSKLELSKGNVLDISTLKAVKPQASDTVTISWANNSNGDAALPGDKVVVVVINTATGETFKSLGVKTRATSPDTIKDPRLVGVLPADLSVYAFAQRADGSDASPTRYVDAVAA